MVDLEKYNEIIIWGASFPPSDLEGDATSPGRAIEQLKALLVKSDSWNKVVAIVDSNEKFHGKKRLGVEVFEPTHIKNHPDALVIINTISFRAVEKAMENLGISNEYAVVPYYFYHGTIDYEYTNAAAKQDALLYQSAIKELYELEDLETRRYLEVILKTRLRGEDVLFSAEDYRNTGNGIAYFCDDNLAPSDLVTFIDIGAYDGNSIKPVANYYKEKLSRIIAFEPNKSARNSLNLFLQDSHLEGISEVLSYALGSEEGLIGFSSYGQMGQVDGDSNEFIEQKRFDDISEINIIGDPMVKMDIEGAEMDALHGMEQFIKCFQPYLAICIYHKETDLYRVAEYIKSINNCYRLFIRGGGGTSNVGQYRKGILNERRAA